MFNLSRAINNFPYIACSSKLLATSITFYVVHDNSNSYNSKSKKILKSICFKN